MRTKVFTRSINWELYRMSQRCVGLDLPRVRLVNTTADGYFYRMLSDTTCDWAINIDEDAFVVDASAILELLEYMKREGFVNCGMPDGVQVRPCNPIVTNPFFNILNLSAIREQFNLDEIKTFNYQEHSDELRAKLPPRLRQMDGDRFQMDKEEPFYNFFFWMAFHFPTLYLEAETHSDGISTVLKNHEGNPMLYHSWFSREWRSDAQHTQRIGQLYREVCQLRQTNPVIPVGWRIWSPIDRQWQILCRKTNSALLRLKMTTGSK